MITTITTFKLSKPVTREEARGIFLGTAPTYRDVGGLVRKCYILSHDGTTAGGIYLWNSRADADALYTESWKEFVRSKYCTEPSIAYFESPVVVDNLTHEILSDG